MSNVIASPPVAAAPEGKDDIEGLRCPGERAAFALCAASNLVVVALALAVVLAGSAWLAAHPFLAKQVGWIRATVIAAIVALPAAPIGRHVQIHAARNSGVRVGPDQLPELHEQLVRACRVLGIEPLPELYVKRNMKAISAAHAGPGGSIIVLSADIFGKEWRSGIDWLAFVMAGALGSIRLGHTRWWVELLTVYARRIPGLRTPLLMKWTYSRDRCAAFVAPDGIRGLLVEAVGKDVVRDVELRPFLEQTKYASGFWDYLAAVRRKHPQLTSRARALYDAGLFDRARDLERDRARRPA